MSNMHSETLEYHESDSDDEDYNYSECTDDSKSENVLTDEELQIARSLVEAIENSKQSEFEHLLESIKQNGMNMENIVNALTDGERTGPMFAAFACDNVPAASRLLDEKGDPFRPNCEGETPFFVACVNDCVCVVRHLFERGIISNFGVIPSGEGKTALHVAAAGGIGVVGYLLDRGALVNVKMRVSGSTALHIAVDYANLDVVEVLISRGAYIDSLDSFGSTPLMVAALIEDQDLAIQIASILLEKGADINRADSKGYTLLDLSNCNGHYKFSSFVRSKGGKSSYIPADSIGFGPINFEQCFSRGGPGPITRLTSVTIGSSLYVGGGLKLYDYHRLKTQINDTNSKTSGYLPFYVTNEIYTADVDGAKEECIFADIENYLENLTRRTLDLDTKNGSLDPKVDGTKVECNDWDNTTDGSANPHNNPISLISTSNTYSRSTTGDLAYFEITMNGTTSNPEKNPDFSIGFIRQGAASNPHHHLGSYPGSIGYNSISGGVRCAIMESISDEDEDNDDLEYHIASWGCGDTVGAGYFFQSKEYFFTLNGVFLGTYSDNNSSEVTEIKAALSFIPDDVSVQFNFGKCPFVFKFVARVFNWSLAGTFEFGIMAILRSNRNPREILIIPENQAGYYYFDPISKTLDYKSSSLEKVIIPRHFEHVVHLANSRVVISFTSDSCIESDNSTDHYYLFVLDLNIGSWSSPIPSIRSKNRQLSRELDSEDLVPISGSGKIHFLSSKKLYSIDLDTFQVTRCIDVTGLGPTDSFLAIPFNHEHHDWALINSFEIFDKNRLILLLPLENPKFYLPTISGPIYNVASGSYCFLQNKIIIIGGFSPQTSVIGHVQLGSY